MSAGRVPPPGLRRWLSALFGAQGDDRWVATLALEVRRVTTQLSGTAAGPAPDGAAGPVQVLEGAFAGLHEAAEALDRATARVEWRAGELAGELADDEPDLERRLAAVETLLDRARAVPPPGPGADEQGPTATATELMRVLDRVSVAAASGGRGADPLLVWLRYRLVALLAGEGVSLIEDQGPFDVARHEVVDTRSTDDPDLAQRISGTVRPGYEQAGIVLRPQQVVLWELGRPADGAP